MVYQNQYHNEYQEAQPPVPAGPSAADRVFVALERAILTGQLKPRERLVERDLVNLFSVSRTPIREALTRLQLAGLVASEGKRGYVVRDFTRKEVRDLYFLRECLERAAAPLVAANISDADIAECSRINDDFRLAWHAGDLRTMIEKNTAFHTRLLQVSGNRFLGEDLERVRTKVFRFRYSMLAMQPVAESSVTDHDRMLQALKARDAALYERLVIKHMNDAKDRYLALNFVV